MEQIKLSDDEQYVFFRIQIFYSLPYFWRINWNHMHKRKSENIKQGLWKRYIYIGSNILQRIFLIYFKNILSIKNKSTKSCQIFSSIKDLSIIIMEYSAFRIKTRVIIMNNLAYWLTRVSVARYIILKNMRSLSYCWLMNMSKITQSKKEQTGMMIKLIYTGLNALRIFLWILGIFYFKN